MTGVMLAAASIGELAGELAEELLRDDPFRASLLALGGDAEVPDLDPVPGGALFGHDPAERRGGPSRVARSSRPGSPIACPHTCSMRATACGWLCRRLDHTR